MKTYKKYFKEEKKRLEKLEKLHERKEHLKELLQANPNQESYVVELCGLPRTGKTVSTERVFSFFKYGNIDAKIADEPAFLVKNSLSNEELKNLSKVDFNDKTLEVSRSNLEELKKSKPTIILMDRGIIDNYFWYQMMYQDGILSKEEYIEKMKGLKSDLEQIDQLYMLTADPKVVISRDYLNEIYLDARTKTTMEGVKKLKQGYESLIPEIKEIKGKKSVHEIDTTKIDVIKTPIIIANDIMKGLEKKLTPNK